LNSIAIIRRNSTE